MTPTSATGTADRARDGRAGFTLVELMVVVAIMGLATGAVLLTAPASTPSIAAEADQLAARLASAREEAVMTNRPVAAEIDRAGYRFADFDGRDWRPLSSPYRDWRWSDGVEQAVSMRIVFDPSGAADPAAVTLMRDGRARRVSVDGAGEVVIDD